MPSLKTARNDAQAVADILRNQYGYSVELLQNATRDQVFGALQLLSESSTLDDNVLIYYAGHGYLDGQTGVGYWLPVDAEIKSKSKWISNSDIAAFSSGLSAKHFVIVADSCYAGSLNRDVSDLLTPRYVARIARKRARVVISSGGVEPVTDSGPGGHSVFATYFLRALAENTGVLDAQRLFLEVKRLVVDNADQVPEYGVIRNSGHEGGDFLFAKVSVSPEEIPAATGHVMDRESADKGASVAVGEIKCPESMVFERQACHLRHVYSATIPNSALGSVREPSRYRLNTIRSVEVAANERELQALADHSQERPRLLLRLANRYAMEARTRSTAIKYYREIVEGYPDYKGLDEALYSLAYELERQGDFKNARSRYFELIQKEPKSRYIPACYLAFGEMFSVEAQTDPVKWDLAVAAYQEVIKYPPPTNKVFAYTRYKLALAFSNKSELPQSLDQFVKVAPYLTGLERPTSEDVALQQSSYDVAIALGMADSFNFDKYVSLVAKVFATPAKQVLADLAVASLETARPTITNQALTALGKGEPAWCATLAKDMTDLQNVLDRNWMAAGAAVSIENRIRAEFTLHESVCQ